MEPVSCSTLCATQTSEFIASSLGTCSSTRSEAKPVLRRVERAPPCHLFPVTRRPGAWGQLRGPRALDGGHNKIGNLEAISQILTLFPLLLSCQLRDFAKFQCQEMTPTRDYSLLKVPNTSALLSLSSIIKLAISCQLLTLQTSTHRIQRTVKHSSFIDP